jgi:hypothetical protein
MQTIPTDRATRSDGVQQRSLGDKGCLPGLWHALVESKGKGQLSVKLPRKTTKVNGGPGGIRTHDFRLKEASAFLTGSQRRLDTKSTDFEPPRYLIFRESGSPI